VSKQVELVAMGHQEIQAVPEPPVDANLLSVIARAAADPAVDVDKMQRLLDMHERMVKTRAEVEFKAALARIQPRMPRVVKDGLIAVNGTTRSKYAKYEDIDSAIRPMLAEEGFSVDFDTRSSDKHLTTILRVSHSAGHSETREISLPFDTSGSKNPTQGVGSTMQYGKRYLLCGFFNIIAVDQDDDGQGGVITDQQAMTIETLIKDTKADRLRFLKFMGASNVDSIPANQYERAINALRSKARQ